MKLGSKLVSVSALCAIAYSCGDSSYINTASNFSSAASEAIRFFPPANLNKTTDCALEMTTSPDFMLNGKVRTYKSARDVDFQKRGWEGRLAASWNEFNYKNLGTPGINIDNSRKTPATIPENVRIAVIDVRNVGGVPHYYYMSNETAFAPIEQWSITKYPAVNLAINDLRKKSNGRIGADSKVDEVAVSKYITSIGRISDNPTAAWFKSLMGAESMTEYIQSWILKSDWDFFLSKKVIPEIFLGKYGQKPASYGGDSPRFISPAGDSFSIDRNLDFPGSNTLSPLTMVEMIKRFRVSEQGSYPKMDYLLSADKQKILYGAPEDEGYGGFLLGGTKSFAVDAFGGKDQLDRLTGGKWRIFGKTGSGYSSIRGRYEGVFLGSVCLPKNKNGLTESRQLIFMVNAQAKSSERRWEIRYEVLRNIAKILIPELNLD